MFIQLYNDVEEMKVKYSFVNIRLEEIIDKYSQQNLEMTHSTYYKMEKTAFFVHFVRFTFAASVEFHNSSFVALFE